MSAPPTACPRCGKTLIRNHDRRECLVHGEVFGAPMAHEMVAAHDVDGRHRSTAGHYGAPVPWTEEERELWRRAEAGEVFPPQRETEGGETMDTPMERPGLVISRAEDLAGPVVARLRDMAARYDASVAALAAMREEMGRLLAVADLLGAAVPAEVRASAGPATSAKGKNAPRAVVGGEIREGRWTCARCGWQSAGAYPGRHEQACAKRAAAGAER